MEEPQTGIEAPARIPGRDQESELVERMIADGCDGAGSAVVFVGDPGRTVARFRRAGAPPAIVTAHRAGGRPPIGARRLSAF